MSQLDALDQARVALVDLLVRFGPKALVAILILVAGFYAGRAAGGVFDKWMRRLQLEPPLRLLLVRTARLVVLALFLLMALQNLGVDLVPLIAGIGVAGAGIALAMQGVLGNLAAGLTIIFTRPFRVGEYVAMAGVDGRVESIDLFTTTLSHADRSIVVVPNRKIVGEILHNYGDIRQLDLQVSVARSADLEGALAAVDEAVGASAHALKDPAPIIGVRSLGDNSISIAVMPWVKWADFAAAGGEINRAIVARFRAAGIEYPFPVATRELPPLG